MHLSPKLQHLKLNIGRMLAGLFYLLGMPSELLICAQAPNPGFDLTDTEALVYKRVMQLAADYAKKAAFEQRNSRAIRRHGFAIIANPWCTLWRMFSKGELSIEDVKACLCRGYVIASLIGE